MTKARACLGLGRSPASPLDASALALILGHHERLSLKEWTAIAASRLRFPSPDAPLETLRRALLLVHTDVASSLADAAPEWTENIQRALRGESLEGAARSAWFEACAWVRLKQLVKWRDFQSQQQRDGGDGLWAAAASVAGEKHRPGEPGPRTEELVRLRHTLGSFFGEWELASAAKQLVVGSVQLGGNAQCFTAGAFTVDMLGTLDP